MNALLRLVERLALAFNQLPLWQGTRTVWGLRFASATFDRWLYLLLHRAGLMGRAERAVLQRLVRPGMTVLDVGGNLGLYTLLLSRLVGPTGRIISFEPDPELCALLRRNCALNGCTNVEAHERALGARPARLVLRRLILNSGDNTLGPGGSPLFRRDTVAEVVALDEFLPGLRPDLVKLDVQGWELPALQGMQRTLAATPHTVVCLEFWPGGFRRAGYGADDVLRFLQALGFRLRLAGTGAPLDEAGLAALTARLTGLKHADLLAQRGDAG